MLKLTLLILALLNGRLYAQEAPAPLNYLYDIVAPDGDIVLNVSWSPDSRYFNTLIYNDDAPTESVSRVYESDSAALLYKGELVAWYAEGGRILVRNDDGIVGSYNLETRTVDFTLPYLPPDMSALILRSTIGYRNAVRAYITNEIVTLDLYENLKVYDSRSGEQVFAAQNVLTASFLTPDETWFAVESSVNGGVTVYDTMTWTIVNSTGPCFGRSRQEGSLINEGRSLLLGGCACGLDCDAKYVWTIGVEMSAPLNNLQKGLWATLDGARVVARVDNNIVLYNAVTGERIDTIMEGGESITYIGFSNNRYVIIVRENLSGEHDDYSIDYIVWDAETGNFVLEINSGLGLAHLVGNTLRFLDAGSFFAAYDLTGERDPVSIEHGDQYVSFSPDSRWALTLSFLAEGQQRIATLYDLLSEARVTFEAGKFDTISWSPDSRRFALYNNEAVADESGVNGGMWEIRD